MHAVIPDGIPHKWLELWITYTGCLNVGVLIIKRPIK